MSLVERVARRYLQASVDPLSPEEAGDYVEEAVRRVKRFGDRTIRIVQKPSATRNPDAYDLRWKLDLEKGAVHIQVQISYLARRGVHLQVSEQRQGRLNRLMNETYRQNNQYKLVLPACLSHYYERQQGPR